MNKQEYTKRMQKELNNFGMQLDVEFIEDYYEIDPNLYERISFKKEDAEKLGFKFD